MGQMAKRDVVAAFLRHGDKILLLKRSQEVSTYQGYWAAISGYINDQEALDQACIEIAEETGLEDEQLSYVCDGEPLEIPAPELDTCWVVHPFLFDVSDPELIKLDWESEELQWVRAEEIHGMATVPSLIKVLARCLERERSTRH